MSRSRTLDIVNGDTTIKKVRRSGNVQCSVFLDAPQTFLALMNLVLVNGH
jgi:hypothetical protein